MKCFNHEDREAVAQCKNCKKGLCKECYKKNNGLCTECMGDLIGEAKMDADEAYENYSSALKKYRRSCIWKIILGIIIGIILLYVVGPYLLKMPAPNPAELFSSAEKIIQTYMLFCTPIGFLTLGFHKKDPNSAYYENTYLVETDYGYYSYTGKSWILMILIFGFKVVLSFILGGFCFIYLVIKIIKTTITLGKLKKDYKEGQKEVADARQDLKDYEKELEAEEQADKKAKGDAVAAETIEEATVVEETPAAETVETEAVVKETPAAPATEAPVAAPETAATPSTEAPVAAPETPAVPTAPEAPVAPVVPATPETPAAPAAPVAPAAPAAPATPETPITPVAPEVPATPAAPTTPEAPTSPENTVPPTQPTA